MSDHAHVVIRPSIEKEVHFSPFTVPLGRFVLLSGELYQRVSNPVDDVVIGGLKNPLFCHVRTGDLHEITRNVVFVDVKITFSPTSEY